MKVSSQLCRLCTVETLIIHLLLTEKSTVMKQHFGCSALRAAGVHRNFRLPGLGHQDSKTSARIWKYWDFYIISQTCPFNGSGSWIQTAFTYLVPDFLEDTRPLGWWKKGHEQIQILILSPWDLIFHTKTKGSVLLLLLWWVLPVCCFLSYRIGRYRL